MSDETQDPALENAIKWAQYYAAMCNGVLSATNACMAAANQAVGARDGANQRPQHEISVKNFTKLADAKDREFVPLYEAFADAITTARDAATSLRACQTERDPEMILADVLMRSANPEQAVGDMEIVIHILRAEIGSSPQAFMVDIKQMNAALQTAVPWGETGFLGFVWAPPAPSPSDERTCPWCAETIKAAAVICRFCSRDIRAQPNTLPG